jgi:hypothetical protein
MADYTMHFVEDPRIANTVSLWMKAHKANRCCTAANMGMLK